MKPRWRTLLRPYQAALHRYLRRESSASLQPATRLGRQALALGLETLDLALIHEQALLAQVLSASKANTRESIVKRARIFFAAAITPIEATHRSALENNVRLGQLNQDLGRRSFDLMASNRALKKEVSRRQRVEKNLRQSERHSSRLLEQSERLQKQLRQLSRRILAVQEEERKRISRELHDVIAQVLTGINVRLAALKREATVNTKGLGRKIEGAQRLVEKSVDIVHRFARELRPAMLDDLGLVPALHSFLKKFARETGIRVSLTASSKLEGLNSAERTTLYRVAQEALTNVARHAQASRADVSIHKLQHAVRMQIEDDGRSFDVDRMWLAKRSRHLGLIGMRERVEMVGGRFTVKSAPGRGTIVQAWIPFPDGPKEFDRA